MIGYYLATFDHLMAHSWRWLSTALIGLSVLSMTILPWTTDSLGKVSSNQRT